MQITSDVWKLAYVLSLPECEGISHKGKAKQREIERALFARIQEIFYFNSIYATNQNLFFACET